MAYDVFISWGAPDKDIVAPLVLRLKQLGLAVFEYTHEMELGDKIANRVHDEIFSSAVAVVCLSAESWNREWITTEVAWIESALKKNRMKAVIPIRVGAMGDVNQLPALLKNHGLFVGDFSDAAKAEQHLQALATKIVEVLGGARPLWLPTAIFAMTRTEFDKLVKPRPEFLELCSYVGMDGGLVPGMGERYRDSPDEFRPFQGGSTAKAIIESAVGRLNGVRTRRGMAPIHLRWEHASLSDPDPQIRREARDRWKQHHSLMIIDSLSVFRESIRKVVSSLAQSDRTAVIWLPPYTTRTGALEQLIDTATADFEELNDCVRNWCQAARSESDPGRVNKRVFDVGTVPGLWHWVFMMLADLDDRGPDVSRVGQIQAERPGPTTSPGSWV